MPFREFLRRHRGPQSTQRNRDVMERIVFLERDTVQAEFRRPNFDHEWVEYPESAQHQVLDRLRGATIVISNKLALREPELSRVPELKLIAIAATGFDCVDVDYCRARGIAVCNVRGYAARAIGRIGVGSDAIPVLQLLLKDENAAVREETSAALALLGAR